MNTGERFLREGKHQQRRKTPSFSSSLLDSIYRSIDESNCEEEAEFALCRASATMVKKQSNINFKRNNALEDEEEIASLKRAIMIEKWMENYSTSSRSCKLYNSMSSSSESSSGGLFSSVETESNCRDRLKSSVVTVPRPKQIRTGVSARLERCEKTTPFEQTPKREGRFTRTKSRALKMYGDLKKVKQPTSRGGRLANFLNSLFNSRNVKNEKREAMDDLSSVRKTRSVKDSTTCSSASSFSTSCLSKTPSSRGKSSSGLKRSVRFCPVSIIVDEDCRPCGHKSIYDDDPSIMPIPLIRKIAEISTAKKEFKKQFMDKHKAASYNFRAQRKKNLNAFELREFQYEDDTESCSSSDLFELENIGAVGIGKYREELPVYGTTNLKTNHAIASGLIL